MVRWYDFGVAASGCEAIRFLVARNGLALNGDLESGFIGEAVDLRRHPAGTGFGPALHAVAEETDAAILAIIRNPDVVLDEGLASRIASAAKALPRADLWSLAAAGGLAPGGARHFALYATAMPAIPDPSGPHPLVDAMPDLTLVNRAFAQEVLAGAPSVPDAAFEPVLALEGYRKGRVAMFVPGLCAGIDGGLMARDRTKLGDELQRHFRTGFEGQRIETLAGDVVIDGTPAPGRAATDLGAIVRGVVQDHATGLSLSVIVRTRFDRMHLLRRLLASLSRARRADCELEVILSTDRRRRDTEPVANALANDFCNLTLRPAWNSPARHSRIGNLLGGLRASAMDYVVLIDDDDYVDLFAFDAVAPALFAGNRPLIVTGAEVHREDWESTPSGRWVLNRSEPSGTHPASGWRDMFAGVNRLPICSMLMPRKRLMERLEAFEFRHDLSEDYALFLLVLTDPSLPAIAEIPETFCHISHRGQENSVTMPDRRPWARDIAAYLADITASGQVAGAGLWQLLARHAPPDRAVAERAAADLAEALDRARATNRLLARENDALRRQLCPAARESVA